MFKIRERRSVIAGRLLDGTFDKFEEYKLFVGTLKGLEEAEFIIKKLHKDMYDTIMEDKDGYFTETEFN